MLGRMNPATPLADRSQDPVFQLDGEIVGEFQRIWLNCWVSNRIFGASSSRQV